jgi:hypothetical protein
MRATSILALLLLLGLFGCALPKVEPGSVMLAVLSDPPGARVYKGHENTSGLLGTTPFTMILPQVRGKVFSERLTAVWSSGATSKRNFSWQPDRGQHHKFVFDSPPNLAVQDVEFGLRHLATVGNTTPAMEAHQAHFGWERTKQMYADSLSLSAAILAAKYGIQAPGGSSSELALPSPANRQAQPAQSAQSGYQTRDSFGNLVNSRNSFQTRDNLGNLVNSRDSFQTKDSLGNLVNSKDCFQTEDSLGNLVKSDGC